MGCGASNASATGAVNSNNHYNNRGSGTPTAIAHKPLSMPLPYIHGSPISSGEMNNRRNEFWASRTDGNRITWQTLRTVCEALLADDLPLANAILEASNIATPNGSLEVAYDERGAQYKLPQFVYSDPSELTHGQPITTGATTGAAVTNIPASSALTANNSSTVLGDTSDAADLSENTEDVKHHLKLRMRINPGDHNLQVSVDPKLAILNLKQAVLREVTKSKPQLLPLDVERQRIMFLGRELANNQKISEVGFDDVKVVQIFVRPKAPKA